MAEETIEQQTFRLAQSAFPVDEVGSFEDAVADPSFRLIVNFIRLAKAEEREACAKACDDQHYDWRFDDKADSVSGPRECAIAIRARGEKQNG